MKNLFTLLLVTLALTLATYPGESYAHSTGKKDTDTHDPAGHNKDGSDDTHDVDGKANDGSQDNRVGDRDHGAESGDDQ